VQISNYALIAGILCIAVSTYLGAASASVNVTPPTPDLGGWISVLPSVAAFFIKGFMDLMIVGISIVLFGRSIRFYFERDSKLLRNGALIVSVVWFRWILDATANILLKPRVGFDDPLFSNLVFAIVVGILIAIASALLVIIIHRSSKGFFKKSEDDVVDFGETALTSSEKEE
jgi:hypothetical protein